MSNPLFAVKCKIDGNPTTIHVQTHGDKMGHPSLKVVRTEADAVEHIHKLAMNHWIDDNAGGGYFCAHIDAEGEEHFITDIETDTVVRNPSNPPKRPDGGPSLAQIHSLLKSAKPSDAEQKLAVAAAAGVSESQVSAPK